MARFLYGRNGADQLCWALFIAELVLSLLPALVPGQAFAAFIHYTTLFLCVYLLFRMFSRNLQKRAHENEIYLQKTNKWRTSLHQARVRFKNRKQYKYFKCPQCGVRLRLTRGCGEKNIVCSQCKHTFHVKA